MNPTNDNNAFAETLFIIKCLPYNEQNKIPKKLIEFLDENKNDDYVVKINPNIELENQKLLKETKELLKEIYLSYFISNEEKNKILQNEEYRRIVEEDLKSKRYNSDDIFNKVKKQEVVNSDKLTESNNTSLIEYKESFFARFKNFIFKLLHIKNN